MSASLTNTPSRYGVISRAFHWIMALLILAAIALGIIGKNIGVDSEAAVARTVFVFSLHKTLGVTIFALALARILWALSQPKPAPLHPENRLQHLLAETVHWTLYACLLLVPMTGWIHHAATTGFAPIWWPFGQNLPFVPKDAGVAETFASLHLIFERVLAASILLHVAGALKHALFARDGTLARMALGREVAGVETPKSATPMVLAAGAFIAALGIGAGLGLFSHETDRPVTLAAAPSDWVVTEGSLVIRVTQLGATVEGQFADWTAQITFDPEAPGATKGDVETTIAVSSLTLGTVTQNALAPEFFDASTHPTAVFNAPIRAVDGGYEAKGVLRLRGVEVPVTLPFSLTLEGDVATMSGTTTLDRRDFGMGAAYPDESTVGFGVEVVIDLVAERRP